MGELSQDVDDMLYGEVDRRPVGGSNPTATKGRGGATLTNRAEKWPMED